MLSPLVSLPRRSCSPLGSRPQPSPIDVAAPPLDQVTILCGSCSPASLVWSAVAAALGAAALAGWSNAAMCPICTWNGGCLKELGHVGPHVCGQGHRWGA